MSGVQIPTVYRFDCVWMLKLKPIRATNEFAFFSLARTATGPETSITSKSKKLKKNMEDYQEKIEKNVVRCDNKRTKAVAQPSFITPSFATVKGSHIQG